MKHPSPKSQRCAIYTRKSSEHNLDLAFNSLDAQREACEAYIKSQAHEGWRLAQGHYDDGGLSGASLERPALQRLLDQIRARQVDIVVVYKVDRLTRALADFAKLVELFDSNDVSFVSVTQSFNTTSSMGRLTLNVLLSFAQFEREVIGERVRDKIAASKRKGLWVGGPVPLGYRCENKTLFVEASEAATVQAIFARYLELRSVGLLVADLDRRGIRSRAGYRFGIGALAHLLRNRFYVGEVVYRGEICPGSQEAIVDRELFEAVQFSLDAQAIHRQKRLDTSAGLLVGLLQDDRGNRLTPSHSNKRGVRYRYYVSQAVLQNRRDETASVSRVAAHDLEQAVVAAVRSKVIANIALPDRELVRKHVQSVIVEQTRLKMVLLIDDLETDTIDQSENTQFQSGDGTFPSQLNTISISVPWSLKRTRMTKKILQQEDASACLAEADRSKLLTAIGKARRWMSEIESDHRTFEHVARAEGCGERHVRFLAPLAFLSPKIIRAIDYGTAPTHWTVSFLARALPHDWTEQESNLGLI